MDCCPPPCCPPPPPPCCCIPPPCRHDADEPMQKRMRFDQSTTNENMQDDNICGPPPCCCQPCCPPQCKPSCCVGCRHDDVGAVSQSNVQKRVSQRQSTTGQQKRQSSCKSMRIEDLPAGALIGIAGETYIAPAKPKSTPKVQSKTNAASRSDLPSQAASRMQQGASQQQFVYNDDYSSRRFDDDDCCPPCCPVGKPETAGCSLPAPCCCETNASAPSATTKQERLYLDDAAPMRSSLRHGRKFARAARQFMCRNH